MENSVEAYFKWRKTSGVPVEEMYKNNKYVSEWKKTDVLYSFLGIYVIGIYVFYHDWCNRTDYMIKTPSDKRISLKYLTKEDNWREYEELNKAIEESDFIKNYDSVGNVIPIWPGGNKDKGRSYCFDLPEIYFLNMYPARFKSLSDMYPEAHLECIKDEFIEKNVELFKDAITLLDKIDRDTYIKYLNHIVTVISKREKQLQ